MANRKTSAIWKVFDKVNVDEKEYVVCCLCKSTLPSKSNTTNLWFHLERGDQLHKEQFASIQPLKQPATKRKRTDSHPTRLLDGSGEIDEDNIEMDTTNASSASSSHDSKIITYIFGINL